jgi:deazaflavin-dependent oxidoreductase (nitroreductase family)
MNDPKAFEDALIEDMRAHDGEVTSGPLEGHPILILRSRGAKSGEERRALLTFSRDGDDYVVAGTAGGSPATPGWVHNLDQHPEAQIEAHNRQFVATAEVISDGPERDRLWQQHVELLPWFAGYPEQSGRVIPMVRLKPAA